MCLCAFEYAKSTHACLCVREHVYMYTRTCIYVSTCRYTHVCAHTHASAYTRTRARAHTRTPVAGCSITFKTNTHTNKRTHIHLNKHTHTHTHTHTPHTADSTKESLEKRLAHITQPQSSPAPALSANAGDRVGRGGGRGLENDGGGGGGEGSRGGAGGGGGQNSQNLSLEERLARITGVSSKLVLCVYMCICMCTRVFVFVCVCVRVRVSVCGYHWCPSLRLVFLKYDAHTHLHVLIRAQVCIYARAIT